MIDVLVKKKCSVLCHCSDGWDRTSQLCALTQLCLDSHYRTIKGYLILIEKDWLSFGHQFGKRIGHTKDDSIDEEDRAPIFEQFVDCTWQLLQQFPTAFEFNGKFLMTILDHVYSCRFGTFLFDCPKQREEMQLPRRTLSLWTYIQNCKEHSSFYNSFYNPSTRMLFPRYNAKIIKFWNEHYLKHCPEHIRYNERLFSDSNRELELFVENLKNKIQK